MYAQLSQEQLREELEALMQAILAHEAFARLSSAERVAFQSDYTSGLVHLLRTGGCRPMFNEMEEWFEYLEELADYDEFEDDMREQGIDHGSYRYVFLFSRRERLIIQKSIRLRKDVYRKRA